LMVAVVKLSCGTSLMALVGFPQLAAARQITAGPAAIALSPIAMAADVENFAAPGGIAGPSTKDEFQEGRRPFPKAGLDNPPVSWQAMTVYWYEGDLPSSRIWPRSLPRSGLFFHRLSCRPNISRLNYQLILGTTAGHTSSD
jgi:hypothetical protein